MPALVPGSGSEDVGLVDGWEEYRGLSFIVPAQVKLMSNFYRY